MSVRIARRASNAELLLTPPSSRQSALSGGEFKMNLCTPKDGKFNYCVETVAPTPQPSTTPTRQPSSTPTPRPTYAPVYQYQPDASLRTEPVDGGAEDGGDGGGVPGWAVGLIATVIALVVCGIVYLLIVGWYTNTRNKREETHDNIYLEDRRQDDYSEDAVSRGQASRSRHSDHREEVTEYGGGRGEGGAGGLDGSMHDENRDGILCLEGDGSWGEASRSRHSRRQEVSTYGGESRKGGSRGPGGSSRSRHSRRQEAATRGAGSGKGGSRGPGVSSRSRHSRRSERIEESQIVLSEPREPGLADDAFALDTHGTRPQRQGRDPSAYSLGREERPDPDADASTTRGGGRSTRSSRAGRRRTPARDPTLYFDGSVAEDPASRPRRAPSAYADGRGDPSVPSHGPRDPSMYSVASRGAYDVASDYDRCGPRSAGGRDPASHFGDEDSCWSSREESFRTREAARSVGLSAQSKKNKNTHSFWM